MFAKLAKKSAKIFKVYLKLFKLNKPLARGFKHLYSKSDKMLKIFGQSKHKLSNLVSKAGGEKEAYDAVNKNKLYKNLDIGIGIKKNVTVLVNGEALKVNLYKFSNGIIQISDMWKP